MCGIAGRVRVRQEPRPKAVLGALRHRGPDGEGSQAAPSGECVLHHTRLAIVDPSARSRQPMSTQDGRYWITYNGEVYNHLQIRAELGSRVAWRTTSDTETVLNAFSVWKEECVCRLEGMFAFAIWDDVERELYLARDPLGIKPLLYGLPAEGGLVFASELRALLAFGCLAPRLDWTAAAEFIRQGAIRQPRTLIDGVKMFPAGHTGKFFGNTLRLTRYWSPHSFLTLRRPQMDYEEAVTVVRQAVECAAKRHAMSDVPVGAFLSGGVDSRLVVGTMQRISNRPVKTFTIGVGPSDEREAARSTACELGTDHTEALLTRSDWPPLLETFLSVIDQPSIDGFNSLAVSALARQHVTVALSGLGADELFAGYPHFSIYRRAAMLNGAVPKRISATLHRYGGLRGLGRLRNIGMTLQAPASLLPSLRNAVPTWLLSRLLQAPADAIEQAEHEIDAATTRVLELPADPVNQMSVYEIDGYLRDTLLRDVDVVSMSNGLEVRPVLLDLEVVQLALSLPGHFKLRGRTTKAVLKDAFPDLLPPQALRRPKRGFHVPALEWTPTECRALWQGAFESSLAKQILTEEFRLCARRASAEQRAARQDEWAAFVLIEVVRRQGLQIP
jgi:asparagine synthase (glutamine-hydrolysing)